MRCCSSRGGRGNSCTASVFQLIVGDKEPTEIAMAWSKKLSLCRKNGSNFGRQMSGLARSTIAWASKRPQIRLQRFALVCVASAEDDVARIEAQLGAFHVCWSAPTPEAQRIGVKMLQADIDVSVGLSRLDALRVLSAICSKRTVRQTRGRFVCLTQHSNLLNHPACSRSG